MPGRRSRKFCHPRKKVPDLAEKLTALVEAETGGDPMSRRKWVRSSLRHLSGLLRRRVVALSRGTVGRLLKGLGFSLRANEKRLTGPPHPDRDRQFGHIEAPQASLPQGGPAGDQRRCEEEGTRRRLQERRAGLEAGGRRRSTPTTSARTPPPRAAPYGVYDLTHNQGHVTVGTSADTAEFAVDAIAGWWEEYGSKAFPGAGKILILADAGGSNSCRTRLWKLRLQEHLVDRLGLCVTVCHYPSGASKWNPVEHRLVRPDQRELGGQAAAVPGHDVGIHPRDGDINRAWV